MGCSLGGLLHHQLEWSYLVCGSSPNVSQCFLGTAVVPLCAVQSRKGWQLVRSTETLVDSYSGWEVNVHFLHCTQDMCTAEATASLLQVEETFSACLARIDALILKPLLQAGRLERSVFFFLVYSSSLETPVKGFITQTSWLKVCKRLVCWSKWCLEVFHLR